MNDDNTRPKSSNASRCTMPILDQSPRTLAAAEHFMYDMIIVGCEFFDAVAGPRDCADGLAPR